MRWFSKVPRGNSHAEMVFHDFDTEAKASFDEAVEAYRYASYMKNLPAPKFCWGCVVEVVARQEDGSIVAWDPAVKTAGRNLPVKRELWTEIVEIHHPGITADIGRIGQGLRISDVAKEHGISRTRVAQIKKRLAKEAR